MGYIVDGVYHREGSGGFQYQEATTHKQYRHDRGREKHARAILQPYDNQGNPSKEFIQAYPGGATRYFSDDQLKEFGG